MPMNECKAWPNLDKWMILSEILLTPVLELLAFFGGNYLGYVNLAYVNISEREFKSVILVL